MVTRLLHYASQEGCDGEPYDTMQEAADLLRSLIPKEISCEESNLISDCGCRFKDDFSNAVILCEECSKLPCHNHPNKEPSLEEKLAMWDVVSRHLSKNDPHISRFKYFYYSGKVWEV